MALKWEHFSSRQVGWMPKGESLVAIAKELNERPRRTLNFTTPSQALAEVLR